MGIAPHWYRIEYRSGEGEVVLGWALASEFGDVEEPPEIKRIAGEDSSDSDDDESLLPRPAGLDPKFWGRFLAAREWKADGDRLLAQRGLRARRGARHQRVLQGCSADTASLSPLTHLFETRERASSRESLWNGRARPSRPARGPAAQARDAALAYDVCQEYINTDDVTQCREGNALCGQPWAAKRFAPILEAFWRATALNAAVALLASGESQPAIDALARTAPNLGLLRWAPMDPEGLFCRAEALNRLRFPGLALDQLAVIKDKLLDSLDDKNQKTLDAAIANMQDKIAALAKPKRKTKKRW